MFREIKKKLIILENRKPYDSKIRGQIHEMNLLDWVASSIRLSGGVLGREEIERIIGGELIREISLNEHADVEKYRDLCAAADNMLAMSYSLNKDMLSGFYKRLAGDTGARYRRENVFLAAINYAPPGPSEIDDQMDIVMNWFYSDDSDRNPVLKAAYLHHRIVEVYPFDVYSEAVALAAMYYYLMEKGYPPFEINMSEQEYNISLTEYLKKEDINRFHAEIERSIHNKLEAMIKLTAI